VRWRELMAGARASRSARLRHDAPLAPCPLRGPSGLQLWPPRSPPLTVMAAAAATQTRHLRTTDVAYVEACLGAHLREHDGSREAGEVSAAVLSAAGRPLRAQSAPAPVRR